MIRGASACHLGGFGTDSAFDLKKGQPVAAKTSFRWSRPLIVAAALVTTSGIWSSPAAAIPPLCGSALVTIQITGPTDQLVRGTAGRDVILGSWGADNIDGGGGNDVICGKDGNDTIHGGDGNDILFDGRGDDTIHGDAGADYINDVPPSSPRPPDLQEAYGHDLMYGGSGDDSIFGGAGFDVVYGNAGNDKFLRGEQVFAGTGNDLLSVDSGSSLIVLHGDDGDDIFLGWSGNTSMYGGDGRDGFECGSGNDRIVGGAGNDWFVGNPAHCEEVESVP